MDTPEKDVHARSFRLFCIGNSLQEIFKIHLWYCQ